MDEDIEDLRKEKRKELEQQQEDKEKAAEEQRKQIRHHAAKHLTKDAKSRLGNIRAANPEKASSVEMQIAQLGKTGQINKITDKQLKDILRSITEEERGNNSDIKFRR